jgi:signal transduction histidine kinase/CheY-like chemotaxis protein
LVPNLEAHWIDYLGKVARTGEALHFEAPASAMQRLFSVFAYRIEGEGSNKVGIFFNEITERKAMEEVVRDVQRREAIGVLSAGIAHDFNNLLAVMMGNISLAQTEIPPGARLGKYLSQTMTAIESAASLTRQMLAYSGKGKFLVEPVDLVSEIQKNVSLLTVSVPKNVRLEMNLSSRKVFITGDRGQLNQILMNLVINSGDATGEKQGKVIVTLTVVELEKEDLAPFEKIPATDLKPGAYALLEVSDNGVGMSPETMAHIFDPFFTTKFIGRGLGLSAVLGIIKGHEGGITIESTEGVGTTFRIILPCCDELEEAEPEAMQPASLMPTEKPAAMNERSTIILVIDDEPDVADMACDLLASAHYRALAETNPLKGIEVYREHKTEIGLILLDWSMPEMNGRDAAHALHEIDPEARIIITSGYSAEEIKAKLGTETVAGVLQKPYSMEALHSVVEKVTA